MGLLDMDMSRPEAQGFNNGLLGVAQALLTPQARGGGMGAAFAAFPAAIDRAKQQAMREQLMALQGRQLGLQTDKLGFDMEQARAQAAQKEALKAQIEQWISTLPPEQQGIARMMPQKFAETMLPQAPKLETIFTPQGQEQKAWVRGPGFEPQPVGGPKQPQMPWEYEIGPDGQPRMKPGVMAAKTTVGKASAPSVEMKVENKMGESVGQQVGPILKAARDQTLGAISLGRAGEEIVGAVNSGKVLAGPGSKWLMFGAQVADSLGVGGKNNEERLQNTRRVIRGLADSAVEARKRLAGQGQVTENEAKAVEKASSGNIDELTADEIKLIANLNIKAARLAANDYRSQLERMPTEMSGARPFYEIPGLDKWTAPVPQAPTGQPSGGRLRFNPATGRLEPAK